MLTLIWQLKIRISIWNIDVFKQKSNIIMKYPLITSTSWLVIRNRDCITIYTEFIHYTTCPILIFLRFNIINSSVSWNILISLSRSQMLKVSTFGYFKVSISWIFSEEFLGKIYLYLLYTSGGAGQKDSLMKITLLYGHINRY